MQRMMSDLEENYIKFENSKILTILDNVGKLWFGGTDSASALDYKDPKKAIQRHVDDDDKVKLNDINTDIKLDKHPHSIFISEGGLYGLIFKSELEKAKTFKKWVTSEVLPSIREFGYYKMKKKYEDENTKLMQKINYITKQNKEILDDLKKEEYPEGALVYVLDYSDEDKEVYRLGKTDDMAKRKKIYDTHMLHKKKVIHMQEFKNPLQLEMCVRSMLYEHRYKKDFFICKLETIKSAFKECENSIKCMTQKGGGKNYIESEIEKIQKTVKVNEEKLYKAQIIIEDFREKLNGGCAETESVSSRDGSEEEKPKKVVKKVTKK